MAEQACSADNRVRYFCHPENIGAAANFRFAAMQADAPYFMWASDDDQWHPEFISTNLQQLNDTPQAQMSFCTVDVINIFGDVLFRCPGFSRFCSCGDVYKDAVNYLEDPEALGKANLIYGIYRTPAVQSCVDAFWDRAFARFYGGDFVFVYAFICRHAIVAHDAVHMRKRQPTRARTKIHWRHPRTYSSADRLNLNPSCSDSVTSRPILSLLLWRNVYFGGVRKSDSSTICHFWQLS